jgi:hypothetical protein
MRPTDPIRSTSGVQLNRMVRELADVVSGRGQEVVSQA